VAGIPEESRMTDIEWSRAICLIDGNALRAWLEKFAPKTGANPEQINKLVGLTGPQNPMRVKSESVGKIMEGV